MQTDLKYISSYILLFLLQVVLDCFLDVGIYVHISILPLIVIALPYKWHVTLTMPSAFLIGLLSDFAAGGVLGVNAAAAVAVAAFRNPLFKSLVATDGTLPAQVPSSAASGVMPYLRFLSAVTLIFITVYVIMDGFSFSPSGLVPGRIAAGSVVSIAICFWINILLSKDRTDTNNGL